MQPNEREALIHHLMGSRDRLLASIEALDPERWAVQPAPGRWSIAECIEHLAIVERRVGRGIEKALNHPPDPEKRAQAASQESVIENLSSRAQPAQAPEQALPQRQWTDPSEVRTEFEAARAATLRFARETDADLRSHFFPHGRFGELDCYQWLMLLSKHCERHTAQIEEVKGQLR